MREERGPRRIIEEKEKKTDKIVTDKTLFEGFYFSESPSSKDLEKPEKEISEYKEKLRDFKEPFSFTPNEARETALGMLKSGKFEQEQVIKLIEDPDFVVSNIGIFFLDKPKGLSKKTSVN